jgi:hypothetical protein
MNPHAIRNFLWAGYLHALALLQRLHEACGLDERFECSGVEPGKSSTIFPRRQDSNLQVGDLQLAAPRRFNLGRVADDVFVKKVQASDCPIRRDILRLLFDADRFSCVIERYYALALGIAHLLGEDCPSLLSTSCKLEQLLQAVSEEDVIT